jgi:ribosomal-protein-alanine N-acetyltransferase
MEIVFETERLRVRHWTPEDESTLLPIVSDPVTMRFWERPFDREQTRAWLERSIAGYEENGFGRWAVERRDDGALLGDAGLLPMEVDGRPEIDLGYIVHHPFWRQGFAVEVATGIVRHAFRTLEVDRLVANMAEDHAGSRAVAEKIGMRLESTFLNPRNRNLPTLILAIER